MLHIVLPLLLLFEAPKIYTYDIINRFELLIIADPEVEDICNDFAAYKNRLGIFSRVLTVDRIYRDFPGSDLPDRIRNAIRFFRDNYGIRYVLLVGDYDRIPARVAYVRFSGNNLSDNVPTDFFYSELRSEWDRNRNGLYGERADSVRMLPEVMVGRIPYHNVGELEQFFAKLRGYKESWLEHDNGSVLLHCADIAGNGASYQSYAEPIVGVIPPFFKVSRLYEIGTTVNISKRQFIDTISTVKDYVVSIAHGDFSSLYINQTPQISINRADLISIPILPSAFWSILSCDVGGFDRDALGEGLIFHPSVIGLLTQTRDGVSSTYIFIRKFLQDLLGNLSFSLGQADSAFRAFYGANAANSLTYYYSILTYVLFGDPSFVPRKGRYFAPALFEVKSFEDTLLMVKFKIFSTPGFSGPVKIVVYKDEDFAKVIEASSDSILIPIKPSSPGYVHVTLTGVFIKDAFDSVYVKPSRNSLKITLKRVVNEYGDSILTANSSFQLEFGIINTGDGEVNGTLEFFADFPVTFLDTSFDIRYGRQEMGTLVVPGHIGSVPKDTVLRVVQKVAIEDYVRLDTLHFPVHKPKLMIENLNVLQSQDGGKRVDLKLFNPSMVPMRDIRFFVLNPKRYFIGNITVLPSRGTLTSSFYIPSDVIVETLGLYFHNDSLVFPIPGGLGLLLPPKNLKAYSNLGSVFLRWEETQYGVVYNVYRIIDNDIQKVNKNPLGSLTFEDYDASGLCGYYVTSVDTVRFVESGPSNVVYAAPNPPYFSGWPVSAFGTGYSTPAICELDITSPGLEVVIGASFDSTVYAFDCYGRLLTGWPVKTSGTIISALAAGDLDGDGEEEVVFNIWNGAYSLHALNKFGLELQGFPINFSSTGYSTPALIDLDRDGKREIIVKDGSFLRIFKYPVGMIRSISIGPPLTSPAVADMDGDGAYEIIATYSQYGAGYIGVWDENLNPKSGFPVLIGGANITSPSVGDVFPSSPGPEIVVHAADSIYIYSQSGQLLNRFYTGRSTSWPWAVSPALGDVDGDGIKDIAIPYDNGIRVYRYDGTLVPGFPAPCGAGYSSCIVVDIDGDGKGEVFKGSVNGTIEGYKYGGEKVPGFPIDVYSYAYPTPQVVDLNGDGKYELVASSFANLVFVYNTEWNIGQSPWPMYKHDRFRTGWAEYTESQGTDGVSLTKESSDSREELMAGEITIFDVSGRVVFKGDAVEGLKILKGLRYGVYFVKQKGNQKLVKRVVVR